MYVCKHNPFKLSSLLSITKTAWKTVCMVVIHSLLIPHPQCAHRLRLSVDSRTTLLRFLENNLPTWLPFVILWQASHKPVLTSQLHHAISYCIVNRQWCHTFRGVVKLRPLLFGTLHYVAHSILLLSTILRWTTTQLLMRPGIDRFQTCAQLRTSLVANAGWCLEQGYTPTWNAFTSIRKASETTLEDRCWLD